jgi:phosphopantetheine adenylyltransferase
MTAVETEPGARHVLVVANETVTGKRLIQALERRAQEGPVRVTVIAPINHPREGYVVYEDTRRAAAGRRLDRTLALLRGEGIPAHGLVVDTDPLNALRDGIAQLEPDEIIVSTHPEQKSGWLRRNLVDQMRSAVGGRPFEHVVADTADDQAREANVLVVANETLLGEPLLERIRERAGKSPASFLIVSPQSDPTQGSHPEAERRLRHALADLRGAGIDAHGQIAHPDPYAAAMQAVRDERVDEIIVSTFPQQRSGWLRRDLVGRLRNDSGVPVDHIVVDPAQAEARA